IELSSVSWRTTLTPPGPLSIVTRAPSSISIIGATGAGTYPLDRVAIVVGSCGGRFPTGHSPSQAATRRTAACAIPNPRTAHRRQGRASPEEGNGIDAIMPVSALVSTICDTLAQTVAQEEAGGSSGRVASQSRSS